MVERSRKFIMYEDVTSIDVLVSLMSAGRKEDNCLQPACRISDFLLHYIMVHDSRSPTT